MCDEILVQIYDTNSKIIGEKTDSMEAYAIRKFEQVKEHEKTVFVDMLIYGAAAQNYFNYNTENLATAQLTDAHMSYASELKTLENKYNNLIDYADYYRGSNLVVGSHIEFMLAFKGGSYAKVSYVNYLGRLVEHDRIDLENKILTLDCVTPADARQELTITVYNDDGSIYVELNESIESYCARNIEKAEVFKAFMAFADSAKAHLLSKNSK